MSSATPGSWWMAVSVCKRATGRSGPRPTSARARRVDESGQALETARDARQSVGERRELPGEEREQALPDEVDPAERVPGLLAQLGVREVLRLELLDDEVPVDRLVARLSAPGSSSDSVAIQRSANASRVMATSVAQIRPAVVEPMVADVGRVDRLERVILVEERVEQGQEGGHRPESRGAPPLPSRAWHRTGSSPVTLTGRRVRLEPLAEGHLDDLARVAYDAAIWRWTIARPMDDAGLRTWLEQARANAVAGLECPFATIDLASGRAIGSSRYMTIAPEHRRLEIGWTWVATAFQRTGANREAKLLQLTHAFEALGAERVEFKTHARNERVADRAPRHRRDVRGRPAPPHDHARRLQPRLGVLLRARRRVARGQGPTGGRPSGPRPA